MNTSPTVTIRPGWLAAAAAGFRASWLTILLIVAINTGVAAILSLDDARPFWHPFISAQSFGLSIAYAVNAASPWDKPRPVWRLIIAVAIGTAIGVALLIAIKGYVIAEQNYRLESVRLRVGQFAWTSLGGFVMGLCVSVFFLLKYRDGRMRAAMLKAEADRNLLAKQAVESELKLMQAQVEPHFLFNTLASVQYLTETDPPQASKLLGHLLAYLRAALPQLRSASATLGQEIELVEAYLNILRMRMGQRLAFTIDVPTALRTHAFPPVLLISIVENAVTHGLEPQAEGGTIRIDARRDGDRLVVSVTDTGRGIAGGAARPGQGVGLANVRDRLAALFGPAGRFSLADVAPHGARATIEVPYVDA